MLIMGIDPGIADCGYGLIKHINSRHIEHIASGLIKTSKKESTALRLLELRKDMLTLLYQHKPQVVAVEKIFFGINVATAMKVCEARGNIMSAIAEYDKHIDIVEYVPGEIKKAICGDGKASKDQIKQAIFRRLSIEVKDDNTADALAIALTHIQYPSL